MNTLPMQTGSKTVNRHPGCAYDPENHTKALRAIPLVCALLIMLGGLSAQAGAESTPNPTNDICGVYTLVSVDGKKLPATIEHEGASLQIRSGKFTINADGNCRSQMTFVPPSGKEATVEVTATYQRMGTKLDMQWQGAGRTTGTIEGGTFTMKNEDMLLTYRK